VTTGWRDTNTIELVLAGESAQHGTTALQAQNSSKPPRINLGRFLRDANDELIRS
jgi:hypothetical protein